MIFLAFVLFACAVSAEKIEEKPVAKQAELACGFCEVAVEAALNGIFDTLPCTKLGGKVADEVCKIAGDYAKVCELGIELVCHECKAHSKCSYTHYAACACTRHGYCSKASCPTGH